MKKIAITFVVLLLPLLLSAQPERPRPEEMSREEFVQMQTRDMARKLGLEDGTRKKFIDVYGAFRNEIDEVANKSKLAEKAETEEEIDKMIQANFEVSEKILEIRKRYYSEFKKILKPSQIRQMYRFENEEGRRMQEGPERPDRSGRPGRPGGPDEPDGRSPDHFRMGPPPQM